MYYIAANAGLEGAVIINKVKESAPGTGFNAATEEYVDMVESGILDPVKVTRSAPAECNIRCFYITYHRVCCCKH